MSQRWMLDCLDFWCWVTRNGANMTFDNILLPVDFSDSSFALKADVEWIARKFNSSVTLMHVFEIPTAWYGMGDAYALNAEWLTEIMDEARKRLDAFAFDLPAEKVRRVILEGQPAAEIHQWCRSHPVDLIAMATHGHGAFEGLVMGSVTAKVLHNVNVPLWLSPSNPAKSAHGGKFNVVCGIDMGDEALSVLLYAKRFADAFGADVTLVHSVPEAETRPNKYLDFDLHKLVRSIAQKEISSLQKQAGTNFRLVIADTAISTALAATAAETNANLVFIGRGHSQKFLGRFRTHTYDLLSQVTCPVFSYWHDCTVEIADKALVARISTLQAV
jgi:nucleotide-binding universal stress UspA family protein